MQTWLFLVVFIAGVIAGISIFLIYLKLTAIGTLEVKDVEDGGAVIGLSVNTDNLLKKKRNYALVFIKDMTQSWASVDNFLRTGANPASRKRWIMHQLNQLYPRLETCSENEAIELETRINNLEAELQELEASE